MQINKNVYICSVLHYGKCINVDNENFHKHNYLMKKLYTTLLLAVAAVLGLSAAPIIYGYQTWQYGADKPVTGPIKIDPNTKPIGVTLIADQSNLGHCYSGFYYNYKWYVLVTLPGTQSTIESFSTIDMETGERTPISISSTSCVDLTYDYSTDKVFAVYKGNAKLATLDIKTGAVTPVGDFKDILGNKYNMIALACDLSGQLYGVCTNDSFYKIDKTTGVVTYVGDLGDDAAYDQTMAFDYSTGVLYWYNNGRYGLYTIDTKTGKATPIGNVYYNDEYDSLGTMMIPYINVAVGAPDRVTDRNVTVSGTTVNLSWTLPTKDAQGNTLTSLSGVKVLRDGIQVASLGADATSYADNNVTEGAYDYSIVPYNAAGNGGVDTDPLHVVVGADAPGAVKSFTAKSGNNKAVLTWTAPDKGLNGGTFDPSSLTGYVIKRRVYGSSSQTTIKISDPTQTTKEDSPGYGRYIYSIAAVNDKGEGAYTEAPTIMVKPDDWIVMGQDEQVALVEDGKTYKFFDNGADGYYTNDANDLLTIKPVNPNSYVKVEFTEFEVDTFGDELTIYNGEDESAEKIGSFSSEGGVPSALKLLEASNPTGALTFRFTSDVMDRRTGWIATVTTVVSKANDLAATAVKTASYVDLNKAVDYTVTVKNKGRNEAQGYKVQLRDASGTVLATADGPALAKNASADVKLQYTFAEAGAYNVYGYVSYDADEDLTNNATATITQNVNPEGSQMVQIAAEETDEVFIVPVSFMSKESIYEIIYSAASLGVDAGKKVSMIAFPYYNVESEYQDVPMRVWMGETDKTTLEDIIPASQLKKVYDGMINVKLSDEALVFPINDYEYNGKNLVVMVYKCDDDGDLGGVTFKGTYGDPDSPLNARFDNNDYLDESTLDPEKTEDAFGYGASSLNPDVQILFVPGAGVEDVSVDGSATIKAVDGAISVQGNAGKSVSVYSVDGKMVYSATSVDNVTIAVQSGVYVVRAGGVAVKVIVK